MNDSSHILLISDSYTYRTAALRLEQGEQTVNLGRLLDRYPAHIPAEALLQRGAITLESLQSLRALQDLVYSCDDWGRLGGMYSGIVFRQSGIQANPEEPPVFSPAQAGEVSGYVAEIVVDRTNVGYNRNWTGFHRRRWANNEELFTEFVTESLKSALGDEEANSTLLLDTTEGRLRFLQVLARRIWESDFENYSRFVGEKLLFRTGDETVRNIASGAGGICTEKVQALKFLTDHYGFESEYLIGGDQALGPLPLERLREMLDTFDFRFARRHMRYWQHAALLYQVDDIPVLVDATNGNIPFLFLTGESASELLRDCDKRPVPVRMVEAEELYYYHQVPQDIPLNLFFALEGWLTDTDMVQVFENELGLYLSRDFYIAPIPYRNPGEFERSKGGYLDIARRAGFQCQVDSGWELSSNLGQQFATSHPFAAEKILEAREHLLFRYNEWDLPHHDAGLVVMRLA